MLKNNKTFYTLTFIICSFILIPSSSFAVKFYFETPETVTGSGSVGNDISIATDSSGNPHILHWNTTSQRLVYGTKTTSWSLENVEDNNSTRWGAIAVNSSNQPVVAYGFTGVGGTGIKYGVKSGTWSTEFADTVDNQTPTSISLDLDSSNNPHISYTPSFSNDLKYATKSGSWTVQTVNTFDREKSSIAVDGADTSHISSYRPGDIKLGYNENSSGWSDSAAENLTVSGGGHPTVIDTDSSDNPHIVYGDGSSNLKYIYHNGTSWQTAQTIASSANASQAGFKLDGSNNAYVSYYDSNTQDLKFAFYNGSSWSTEALDTTNDVGAKSSLALDSNNNVHILYQNSTGGNLKYVMGEAGNIIGGQTNNIDFDGGSGTADGISASVTATTDGRIRKIASGSPDTDFESVSFIGDVYSNFGLTIDDANITFPVTLTLNIENILTNPAFQATGLASTDLQIFHEFSEGQYEQLTVTGRTATTIQVTTSSFSDFAIGVNPEPTTLLLLGSGLLGLLPRRKKK